MHFYGKELKGKKIENKEFLRKLERGCFIFAPCLKTLEMVGNSSFLKGILDMSNTSSFSSPADILKPQVGGIAADRLKSFVERLEHLEVEKIQLQEVIKDVFSEAKSAGFDVKTMRQIIKLRKQDADTLAEQEELLDLYKHALGMGS